MTVHAFGVVVQVAGDNPKAAAGLSRPERDVAPAAADFEHASARRDACEQLPPEPLQRQAGSPVERHRELWPACQPLGPGCLGIPPTAIVSRHNAPWVVIGSNC